jgi:dihydroorotase
MHDGDMARRLGVRGLPSDAEFLIVARDLDLVSQTGAHYHCQHVSAERTIDLIRVAKQDGLAVTAEVTPHHLTFDETYLSGLDPDFKMYPPLRTADDRDALREALGDVTIDLVATDHAPHLPEEKHVEFSAAPRGVIGLETAASAVWETLRDPDRFFEVLSIAPAGIVGLTDHGCRVAVGTAANLVVFDPTSEWVPDEFVSRSANSPYRGRTMRGRVRATIHSGGITYQNGAWHP